MEVILHLAKVQQAFCVLEEGVGENVELIEDVESSLEDEGESFQIELIDSFCFEFRKRSENVVILRRKMKVKLKMNELCGKRKYLEKEKLWTMVENKKLEHQK